MEDFFTRAMLGGMGMAVAAGPLGCFVVWRRMAYFGAALAHSGLLGVALGFLLNINVNVGILALCALVAILLMLLEHQRTLASDTLLGILALSSTSDWTRHGHIYGELAHRSHGLTVRRRLGRRSHLRSIDRHLRCSRPVLAQHAFGYRQRGPCGSGRHTSGTYSGELCFATRQRDCGGHENRGHAIGHLLANHSNRCRASPILDPRADGCYGSAARSPIGGFGLVWLAEMGRAGRSHHRGRSISLVYSRYGVAPREYVIKPLVIERRLEDRQRACTIILLSTACLGTHARFRTEVCHRGKRKSH